jgi:hypothetical protein
MILSSPGGEVWLISGSFMGVCGFLACHGQATSNNLLDTSSSPVLYFPVMLGWEKWAQK